MYVRPPSPPSLGPALEPLEPRLLLAGDGIVTCHAVVCGISDYAEVNDLTYCDDDARDVRDALLAWPNWEATNVVVQIDSAATKGAIEAAIQAMAAAADADDVCLFAFAGHGTYGPDVAPYDEADGYDEYICPHDSSLASYAYDIRDDELAQWLGALPTDHYAVILDTCHSGGFIDSAAAARGVGGSSAGVGDGFAEDLVGSASRDLDDVARGVVLTACTEYETCQESGLLENGVFAYYVVEGMAGAADSDGDQCVSAEEIYDYAAPLATAFNPGQHAQLYDGHAGELELLTVLPDLMGVGFAVPAAPLEAGDAFDVTFEVRNDAGGPAGAFEVAFYLSHDGSIGVSDLLLGSTSAGPLTGHTATGTLTHSLTLPEPGDPFWAGDGTYTIGMIVDAADAVTEFDEANNSNRGSALDLAAVPIANTQPFFTLDLPAAAAEGDGVLAGAGTVTIREALGEDLAVALTSDEATELTIPAGVVVAAGQTTSPPFDVTIVDDAEWDLTQWVTVTASADGYVSGDAGVLVHDDEAPTLTVTIAPDSASEADGVLTGAGQVASELAPTVDVVVSLTSDDPTEVADPGEVTIPAGEASAAFDVTVVDDTEIDGDRPAAVDAADWPSVPDTLLVLDDDRHLTVTLPADAWEGDGAVEALITLGGTMAADLTVSLACDDTTEATVPPSVVVPAGETSAPFAVTIVDDADCDGARPATVTAAAGGFEDAADAIQVRDDDVHHFSFAPVGAQTAGVAFTVTVQARDVDAAPIEVYAGQAGLTGAGDAGPVVVTPDLTGAFTGGAWTGQVTVHAVDANVVLTAQAGPAAGGSEPFDVSSGPLDHFECSPVAWQPVGYPFAVTVTAADANGYAVGGFAGPADLSGWVQVGIDSTVVITECDLRSRDTLEIQNVAGEPADTSGWVAAVSDSPTDINAVNPTYWFLPDSIAAGEILYRTGKWFDNYWGADINWDVDAPGWAIVIDQAGGVVDFVAWGWTAAEIAALSTTINGHAVTIGDEFTGDGVAQAGSGTIQRQGDQDHNDAGDFVWINPGSKGLQNPGLTVPFAPGIEPVPVWPAQTGSFSQGVWAGTVTVDQEAHQMVLQVDAAGLTDLSEAFDVIAVTPGDADGNGTVDGADYTAWADHYGQAGGWQAGDFSGDGFVDGSDYTAWADNYTGGARAARAGEPAASDPAESTVSFTSDHFHLELSQDQGRMVRLGYRDEPGEAWTYHEISLFGRYLDAADAAHDTLADAPTVHSAAIGDHTLVKYEVRQGDLFWSFWFDLEASSRQLGACRFVYADADTLSLNGVGMVFQPAGAYGYSADLGYTYDDVGGTHTGGYFDFQDGPAGLRVMFANTMDCSWADDASGPVFWYRSGLADWHRQMDVQQFTFVPYTVGDDLSVFDDYQKQHVFTHPLTNVELAGAWVVRSRNRFGQVRDWFNEADYENGFRSTGSKVGFWRDDWSTGGVMAGLLDTYRVTGDLYYLQRAVDVADYQIDRDTGRLRSRWGANQEWQENYPMGRVRALLDIYDLTGLDHYRDVAVASANWFLDTEVFLPSGCHEYGFYTDLAYAMEGLLRAVALDGPDPARYGQVRDWLVAIDQINYDPGGRLYADMLYDPSRYWARGHGWWVESFMGIMAQYQDDPSKTVLETHFVDASGRLIAFQDGLWHVSIADDGTYLDSSAGTMIAAGFAEAFVAGQLGPEALAAAIEAIAYVTNHCLCEDGTITGTDRHGYASDDPFPYTQEGYVKFARNLGIAEIVQLSRRSTLFTDFDEGVLICDETGGTVTDFDGDVVTVNGRVVITGYADGGAEARAVSVMGLGARQFALAGFDAGRYYRVVNHSLSGGDSAQVVPSGPSGALTFSVELAGRHQIEVEVAIPGDANADGAVDGSDYTAWADHYGQAGDWQAGDFSSDGFVDGADYTAWADNYTGGPGQAEELSVAGAGARQLAPADPDPHPTYRRTGRRLPGPGRGDHPLDLLKALDLPGLALPAI